MLQLKARLLLLIIASDSLLAAPSSACDGHMNVSEEPAGHLEFSPEKEGTRRLDSGLRTCTRTLDIPAAQTVQLSLVWLESGSNMSLACAGGRGQQTLAVGDTVMLSGCDQNRATLTWTGAGHSSNAFQLFYHVHKEESSSAETSPVPPHSHHDMATPDPTKASTDQGPLSGGAPVPSGKSNHPPDLIQPTTPPSASESTDREASLFPGEESNNGPDTSGARLRTDIPERLDFFSTRHSTNAYSEFYTSQNAELQTVSVSNEAEHGRRTYASSESLTNSQTLGFEEKKNIAMSSVAPLFEIRSTMLPQNKSGTVDENKSESTENWESSGTHIANSPRTQNTEGIKESSSQKDFMHFTSSLLELGEHLSTERPLVITENGATVMEIQDSGQTTSMSLDLSEKTKEATQETASTENFLGRQLSSLGTSSPRIPSDLDTVRPYVTQKDLTFQTSTASSTFGERNREDAKPSPRNSMDLSTTRSFFGDTTRLTVLSTQSTSTPSSGITSVTRSIGRSAEGLSTTSPTTISAQQTTRIGEMSSKTGLSSSQTVTTPTLLQVSHVPYQAQSSRSRTLPTASATGHKGEKGATTTVESPPTTSWTPEPVNRVPASARPYLTVKPIESSTVHHKPKYYIVPDEPVIVREESVELLLQIMVEESTSSWTAGWEEDVALWLEPYLQKASGFKELLGVWNSGPAVQCLVQFDTRAALQWVSRTGASSLLERTGLRQAVLEGRSFSEATVTNITLEGVQEACGWLLQCPAGFTCVFRPYNSIYSSNHTSNYSSIYSCSSVCHSEYCLHHGLCTHHPNQPPVCRCVAGQDFWFMGQRCEVRMTRARLVLSCLGVLLLVVGAVAAVACAAVRRYRALLVQAKEDQTRSSYRRFNHFDELSGRFWLRSWTGSADSLDNPAFSRSDEILQLRALERPCCYHDDSLSLPSTCPSPGTHLRTIYPHSSQYGWRGSELSVGDGVLDSGKASDLSVCSWPREPIQWSPFPLLQQLALQRPPAVRVPRTRSCCDAMELVDMNKSWTA